MTPPTPSSGRPRRGLGQRLAGLLPPPRDQALIRLARAARDLTLGRSVPPPARTDGQTRRLQRAAALIDRGNPTGALAQLEPVLAARPTDAWALELRGLAQRTSRIRGRSSDRAGLADDAAAAIRNLGALGHSEPILLPYYPLSPGSPFQELFYSRAFEHGVAPLPLFNLEDVDELLPFAQSGAHVVLHLHWVNRVLHGVTAPEEARIRTDAFLARIDRFLDAGGRLVWTVHNVLPHGCLLPSEEAELRQQIIARATIVHILAARTAEAAAEYYAIPAGKILHVPLPSFRGAYEDIVSRNAARYALGLDPDDRVYTFIGTLKPYKGMTDLLDAWEVVAHDAAPRRLVVAGAPNGDPETRRFLDRAAANPRVSLHARTIPAADIQLFLHAADVVVLPYQRTLNSATLLLALTFGVPIVAPAVPWITEILTPEAATTFEPGSRDSLVAALRDADRLRRPEAREAARRLAAGEDPGVLSARFAEGLGAAVRSGTGANTAP